MATPYSSAAARSLAFIIRGKDTFSWIFICHEPLYELSPTEELNNANDDSITVQVSFSA